LNKFVPLLILILLVGLLPLSATTVAKEEHTQQKAVNQLWKKLNDKKLKLRSESALIVDRFCRLPLSPS